MQTLICDWCTEEINVGEEYSADELDRLGLEHEIKDGRYVVIESRFSGENVVGHPKSRVVIAHFHYPRCYKAATGIWNAHWDWALDRAAGRRGAAMPHWEGEELKGAALHIDERPVPVTGATRLLDRVADQHQREEGTRLREVGISPRSQYALRHAGVVCLEDLVECSEIDLLALDGVGATTIEKLRAALDRRGLGFREGMVTPVEFGQRLRAVRESAGVTVAGLSRELHRAGLGGYQDVSQWQSGRSAPNPQQRAWLGDRLSADIEALLTKAAS
jgi:hypothetical protein